MGILENLFNNYESDDSNLVESDDDSNLVEGGDNIKLFKINVESDDDSNLVEGGDNNLVEIYEGDDHNNRQYGS